MVAYLARRLLLSLLVLVLVTIVTFALAHAVPGDPLAAIVNERVAKPEIIAAYRQEFGLAAAVFAVALGMPLGVLAALRHNRAADHLARAVSLFGASVPVFYLALLSLFVLSFKLQWLPFGQRLEPGVTPPG